MSLLGAISTTGTMASPISLCNTLWRNRELLNHLVARHIRIQYKQSLLGYAWILLNPITQLATLSFVFSQIFQSQAPQGTSFTLFLFIGLLPWIFFSNAVSAATESVYGSFTLVTGAYFPRELLVVSAVMVRFVDLLAGTLIMAVLLIESQQSLGTATLWIPVLFFFHLIFVVGISLPLAALNLFFHDVRYLVGVVIYLWFFFTPIFYALSSVPEKYHFIYTWNLNARLIDAYRYALLENVHPPLGSVAIIAVLSVVSLAVGLFLFKRLEPSFADYV